MGNNGLHKLYGGVYVRCKSTLCPACQHYQKPILTNEKGAGGWANDGICKAQQKLISNANGIGGTCKLFVEHPEAKDVEIDHDVITSIVSEIKPYASIRQGRWWKSEVNNEKVGIAFRIHQHFMKSEIIPTRKSFKSWLGVAIDNWINATVIEKTE